MNLAEFITPFYQANPNAGVSNAIQGRQVSNEYDIQKQRLEQQRIEAERNAQTQNQELWLRGMQFDQENQNRSMGALNDYIKLIQSGQPEQAAAMLPYLQGQGVDISHPGGVGQGIGQGPPAPSVPTPNQPAAQQQSSGQPKAPDFQSFYQQAMASAPADLTPEAPPAKPKALPAQPAGKGIPPLLKGYMAQQGAPEATAETAPPDEVQAEMQRQEQAGIPLPGMPLPPAPTKKAVAPKATAKAAPVAAPPPPEHVAAAEHALAVNGAGQMPNLHVSFRGRDLGWMNPNLPQQRDQADASRIASEVAGMTPQRYRDLANALKAAKTPEEAMAVTKSYLEPIVSRLIGADAAVAAASRKAAVAGDEHEMRDFRIGHDLVYEGIQKNPDLTKHLSGYRSMAEAADLLKSGNRVESSMAYRKLAMELNSGAFSEADAKSPDAFKPVMDKLLTWLSVGTFGDLDEKEKGLLLGAVQHRQMLTEQAARQAYDDQINSTGPSTMYSNPAARKGWGHAMRNIFGEFSFYNQKKVDEIAGAGTAAPQAPAVTESKSVSVRGKGPEAQQRADEIMAGRPSF